MCSLHEDRVTLLKEISTPEPVSMAMDGNFVCVAGQGQYCVLNVETGSSQDLFPYDHITVFPHVRRIAKVREDTVEVVKVDTVVDLNGILLVKYWGTLHSQIKGKNILAKIFQQRKMTSFILSATGGVSVGWTGQFGNVCDGCGNLGEAAHSVDGGDLSRVLLPPLHHHHHQPVH